MPSASAQLSLVDRAAVEGPIPSDPVGSRSRNYPFFSTIDNLPKHHYVEQEFFYSGTTPAGGYKTRMLVRRPTSAAKFSGTVYVEWQNVTNKFDVEPLWWRSSQQLMRDGDIWVGIDAQAAGITSPNTGLKSWSPKRYGSLHLPALADALGGVVGTASDAGMFDIFGQGLRAIQQPGKVDVLGGLKPRTVIATGASQSALYLYLYAQTYDPLQKLTNGFLITSGSVATLGQPSPLWLNLPVVATRVPVLWVNTETDASFHRIPDSSLYRLWEVAGTTHLDRDAVDVQDPISRRDFGHGFKALTNCAYPGLSRIPFKYAQDAAMKAIEDWILTGQAPRSQPSFRYDADGRVARDGYLNALGGVRLPQMSVATATNSRENTGSCKALYGRSVPFAGNLLRLLYPTHADYVAKVKDATRRALADGVLIAPDAAATVRAAEAAPIPVALPKPKPKAKRTCTSRRISKSHPKSARTCPRSTR